MKDKTIVITRAGFLFSLFYLVVLRIGILSNMQILRDGIVEETIGTFLVAVFPIVMWGVLRFFGNTDTRLRLKSPLQLIFVYYIIAAAYMFLVTGVLFRHLFDFCKIDFESDLITGLYMCVISAVVLWLSLKDMRRDKDCRSYVFGGLILLLLFWLLTQHRILPLFRSVTNYGFADKDKYGMNMNWFGHRAAMLRLVLNGDANELSALRLPMFYSDRLPLVWLRCNFGAAAAVAAALLSAAGVLLLIPRYTLLRKSEYGALAGVLYLSLIIQTVWAIPQNLFMIYASHIGMPVLSGLSAVIPMALLAFLPIGDSNKTNV